MIIFPAIDIRQRQVVRLKQGDYGRMNVYNDDPKRVAEGFWADGATHLHTVDLDGAKDGEIKNGDVIEAVASVPGLFIQVGGGIRDEACIQRYLGMGVNRIILGTVAVKQPDFVAAMVQKYREQIVVSVDVRAGRVAANGWLEETDTDSFAFCKQLADMGVRTVVYTDIEKDGQLQGSSVAAYERLAQIKGLDVIASGGVSSLNEIKELRALGIYGAIQGTALYEGRVALTDAIAAAKG